MLKNLGTMALAAVFTMSIGFVSDAEAKRSSYKSSSSSSYKSTSFKTTSSWGSKSKSKSSSYSSKSKSTSSWGNSSKSKPAKKKAWVAGANTKKTSWNKPTTKPAKTVTNGKVAVNKAKSQSIQGKNKQSFGNSIAKTKKVANSKQSFKAQQSKFKPRKQTYANNSSSSKSWNKSSRKSYTTNKTVVVHKTYITNNRSTYHSRRGKYYSSWDTPDYAYNSYNSFGMWDSMALWMMLDNINDAKYNSMYYNNANSAGMREWRREADRMAQDNAELRAKLNRMDAQQQTLIASGTKRVEGHMPEGIDPDLLFSEELLSDTKPVIRVCTGAKDMNYYNVAKIIGKDMSSARIVPVATNGSADNLRKLENGECDGAIVQRDAFWNHTDINPASKLDFTRVMSPYSEIPHLVCNYDSGVTKLSQLSSKHTILVGKNGSGSAVTWKNLVAEEDDFADVRVENVGGAIAKARITTEPNTCALMVSGLNTKFMRDVNSMGSTAKLQLINWNESELFDKRGPAGEQLYGEFTLPSNTYANIQKKAWRTLGSATDVVTVPADFVLNNTWVSNNENAFEYLVSEAAAKIPAIRNYVGNQQ